MNRRNFLKLIGVAPVIPGVLMAAKPKAEDLDLSLDRLDPFADGNVSFAAFSDEFYDNPEPDTDDMKHMEGIAETFADEVHKATVAFYKTKYGIT